MLRISSLAKVTAATTLSAVVGLSANAADRVSDFSLVDHNGKFFQLSRQANFDAIVMLAHEDSRDVRRAASELADLTEQFADQNVGFYLIDSTGSGDQAEMREIAEDADIDLPILIDEGQLVAAELGITRATDVVILDPEAKEVVFRGALNDRWAEGSRARRASEHYAAYALTAFLAGEEITAEQLASKGNLIAFGTTESISYANDIVPILKERCVSCHMEGGIAPFAMTNHQMVQGWSPMIREVLYTKRMPPGQIDDAYVHDFRDVAHITVEETQQ
jgi:peroxiredoxin